MIGKAVFSETAVTIFLTFSMKLGDYKGRKVTEQDFWKKLLIWRYSWKRFQISQKSDTLIFFSKMALTIFLVFSLKLVLNMTFNLNETHFSEKFAIWRYLTSKSPKICPNWGFHTTLWHGRKWELCRRQFLTLTRRCYNAATTLSIVFLGHCTTDYSDIFFLHRNVRELQNC